MTGTYACLAVHAESLERDSVWDAVRRALDRIEPRGVRVTFFVHPFTAIRAAIDIADRIGELAQHGHEIAQHTHFYAEYEETAKGIRKRTDLDAEVIDRCLARDHDYLVSVGFTPRGFVSGGWAIVPEIVEWLQAHGFAYDCSYRTYRLPYESEHARSGDDAAGPFRKGPLLEVPTSATLPMEVRGPLPGGTGPIVVGDVRYRLSYLHDADLLERRKFLSLTRLRGLMLGRNVRHVTAGELAQVVGSMLQEGSPGVG